MHDMAAALDSLHVEIEHNDVAYLFWEYFLEWTNDATSEARTSKVILT